MSTQHNGKNIDTAIVIPVKQNEIAALLLVVNALMRVIQCAAPHPANLEKIPFTQEEYQEMVDRTYALGERISTAFKKKHKYIHVPFQLDLSLYDITIFYQAKQAYQALMSLNLAPYTPYANAASVMGHILTIELRLFHHLSLVKPSAAMN